MEFNEYLEKIRSTGRKIQPHLWIDVINGYWDGLTPEQTHNRVAQKG